MTEGWIPSTCMRCAVGCGQLHRDGEGGLAARGDPDHPATGGLACRRGIVETADPSGERLTRPLVREGDDLVPADWNDALWRVTMKLASTVSCDPDGVAVLGSGQMTNEAAYALGKLARAGLRTRYYDANTTLCMASAVTAYYEAFGSDAPPPTYDDVPEADTHLVWGANPAVAHPVLFRMMLDSLTDDGRLVVVDPVETETARAADRHVRPDPGGDLALARAVLARVVDEGQVDRGFVAEATTGFADLREALPDVAEACRAAGVDREAVADLAAAFEADTLLYWGMGVNQSVQGTATARALVDLCLATGNLGPGTGPFSLTGQANSMGARVCASKATWPGHRPFDDPDARAAVAEAWNVPESWLPDDAGPGPVGVVEAIDDGPVEALWTVATNPVAGLPDATRAADRLDEVFLVVQDAFRTPTTEYADVVLPAATWGHCEGTTVNMERTVSRVRPVGPPPGNVKTDLDVIAMVAEGVAPRLLDTAPCDPERVFDELRALTAGTPADLSGITYDRLEAERAVRWPAPAPRTEGGYRYYAADAAGVEWTFPTPSGKARFSVGRPGAPAEPADDEYPLVLTTAREADAYNTGVRSTDGVRPDEPPLARVHPSTVERYAGDLVDAPAVDGRLGVVESRRAAVIARIVPDDGVPEGLVWMSIHHPGTNRLTSPETDPRSREPGYKHCAVTLTAPAETSVSEVLRACE